MVRCTVGACFRLIRFRQHITQPSVWGALTTHVPQLLIGELRRKTLRPLALYAIAGYGLLCLALVALAFAVSA